MAKRKRMKTMKEVSKHFERFAKKNKVRPITEKNFDKSLKKSFPALWAIQHVTETNLKQVVEASVIIVKLASELVDG